MSQTNYFSHIVFELKDGKSGVVPRMDNRGRRGNKQNAPEPTPDAAIPIKGKVEVS